MKHQFYQPEWFYVPYRIWQDPIGSRWKKMSISPSPASHCGHVRTSPYVPVPSHCLWRVSFVRQLLCEIYISNHHWKVLRKVKQDQICPLENWQFRYSANDYRKQYVRNIDNLRVNGRLRKLDASFIPKKKKKWCDKEQFICALCISEILKSGFLWILLIFTLWNPRHQ